MQAVEFTTELHGAASFPIPGNIAAQLPKSGTARVIVLTDVDADDGWREAAYGQFLKDDAEEDAIYEALA
jgi:hypothetical protein